MIWSCFLVEHSQHNLYIDEPDSEKTVTDSCKNDDITRRHYMALQKEQIKGKPNPVVINKFLNLDFNSIQFNSRRELLKETIKENRHIILLERYPCLKNTNEVKWTL